MKLFTSSVTTLLLLSFTRFTTATQVVFASNSTFPAGIPSPDAASAPRNMLLNAQQHSSEVFNAINSALRQWGSSLKHNGMGFIPVSVPANTLLYHGTNTRNQVRGLEWLAFEIEHAEFFARSRGGPPLPPPHGPPENSPSPSNNTRGTRLPPGEGYLHIYRTRHDITNLLYLDGLSAGKSRVGTLDSQDLLLRSLKTGQNSPRAERERASDLCSLSANIQGIVRMEAGFELILCRFEDHLELDSVTRRARSPLSNPHGPGGGMGTLEQFEYSRGVTKRYDGIANGRIKPEFSRMTSAFWYDLDFSPDSYSAYGDHSLPRLIHSDPQMLKAVKAVVISSLEDSEGWQGSIDWQGVTDMIVTRYADRLAFMKMKSASLEKIKEEVDFLLNVYIDYSSHNQTFDESAALEKCSNHYIKTVTPKTQADILIQESIRNVNSKICSTLFHVKKTLSTSPDLASTSSASTKAQITSLTSFLNWTEWLKCGPCSYDKICYTAIWPFGTVESHFAPFCAGQEDMTGGRGYWG